DDHFKDQCGIFGVFGHPEASNLTYLGLYALQHRGQESAGIVSSDGEKLKAVRGMGLVSEVFPSEDSIASLTGPFAMGHVRYSTTGESTERNIQPLLIGCQRGEIAVAHNGNIVNADILRGQLEAAGSIFQSSSDTEVLLHLYARARIGPVEDAIASSLLKARGAYSVLFLTDSALVAARDPMGIRPLVLGKLGDAYVVSSETCAFDLIEATYIRDVAPGEVLVIDKDGLRSFFPFPKDAARHCVFEHVYFARPDSKVFGRSVLGSRLEMGRRLARESAVPADVVVPVPDSGIGAALGYAEESGLPYVMGLVRNHYIGRTFIEPKQKVRSFGVRIKLNPVREVLEGKRVMLIDDSIVRGTTSRKIVELIRSAGALEVHLRISSPPTTHPCHYGIDTPRRSELIASSQTVEEIRQKVGADTLSYLSQEGLIASVGDASGTRHCTACFTGNYAIPVREEENVELFPLTARG
ncbi:MAG: amidophosphoribosyltransferase, partial [Vicinamibacteria bacterium]